MTRRFLYAFFVSSLVAGGLCIAHQQYLIAILLGVCVSLLAIGALIRGLRRAGDVIDGAADVLSAPNESSRSTRDRDHRVSTHR